MCLRVGISFQFLKICLHFSAVCLQFSKKTCHLSNTFWLFKHRFKYVYTVSELQSFEISMFHIVLMIKDYSFPDENQPHVVIHKQQIFYEDDPPKYRRIFSPQEVKQHLSELRRKIENGGDTTTDLNFLEMILGECPYYTRNEIDFSAYQSSKRTQDLVARAYPEMFSDWKSIRATPDG